MVKFIERFLKSFLPKESDYFSLLAQSAKNLWEAGQEAQKLIQAKNLPEIRTIATKIKEFERQGDIVTQQIFQQLDRTFITPIDREDIHNLANALDDAMDRIDAIVARMALYQVESLTDPMKEMIQLQGEATTELDQMISGLKHLRKGVDFSTRTRKVHKLEKDCDILFRKAMANLFSNELPARELIKQKDILEGLERSLDYCNTLCNIIEQVSIKNA